MGYGQYSGAPNAGRRWTLAEMRERLRPEALSVERVGHNRFLIEYKDGRKAYRLHLTDVVTLHPNGCIELADDGFQTITTRAAMMEGLLYFTGRRYCVYSGGKKAGHVLFAPGGGGERLETLFTCPYSFRPVVLGSAKVIA